MKRTFILLVLMLVAHLAVAQDLTLTTPVTYPSETKFTVRKLFVDATALPVVQAVVEISVRSAGDVEIRYFNVTVPSPECGTATVAGIFTALDTVRSGETGGVLKRANFRLLGYLSDNGCGFPAHTVVP